MEYWARPEIVLSLLALYFAVMAVQLSIFTPSGHFDDTVVLLDAQTFAWGYAPKSPPLFGWLARAAMALTGPRIETIFALRMACLFLMYGGLYLVARRLQPDPLLAVGAGLAMLATLHFHWYFLWKYTNTTLAVGLMPWALLAFFRLQAHRTAASYALFGVVCGVGLLTRYHFAIYLAALAGAAMTNRKWRPVIGDRRIFVALLIAGLIVAPHVLWFLQHWGEIAADVRRNIGFDPSADQFRAAATALGNLTQETISIFIFPLGILVAGLLWPALRPIHVQDPERGADFLLIRNMLFILLGFMALFALAGTTRIRTRHLFFFSFFPLWLIARLDAARLRPFAAPGFVIALGVCLAGAALGFGLQGWEYAHRCKRCEKFLPFDTYAQGIRAVGFASGTIIVSPTVPRGPLLRTYFPDSRVVIPWRKNSLEPAEARGGKDSKNNDCLYVWKESSGGAVLSELKNGGPVPGVRLPLPPHAVFGSRAGKVRMSGRPTFTLRFAYVKGGLGACR
jgi:hypothetical protein